MEATSHSQQPLEDRHLEEVTTLQMLYILVVSPTLVQSVSNCFLSTPIVRHWSHNRGGRLFTQELPRFKSKLHIYKLRPKIDVFSS